MLELAKVEENGVLRSKRGEVLLKVGDVLVDNQNQFRTYKVTGIDLHFIATEKLTVGEFEQQELGKPQEFQTAHLLNGELKMEIRRFEQL